MTANCRGLVVVLGCTLGAVAASCDSISVESGIWAGTYQAGFETSAFWECGEQFEAWWVESASDQAGRIISANCERDRENASQRRDGCTLSVVFEGERTCGNEHGYGHLGGYDCKLEVSQVHEIVSSSVADCETVRATFRSR